MEMKWTRQYGNYYSDDRAYMIEKDEYFGWNLYTKSAPESCVFDVHVINCGTLREGKEIAQRYHDEIAAQEAAQAAAELASIRTPGNIELRAKGDCWIGEYFVKAGRHYIITVYGDGTHSAPGNAYGNLYDFRTEEHATYFTIESRPEAAPVQEEKTMTRETANEIRANIRAAIETHTENRENGPAATVSALVARLGYETAAATVAHLVNTIGTHDGRIDDRRRAWAAENGANRDELRERGIFTPGEIHPAHLDQIAAAMMKYEPTEAAPEEPAQPLKQYMTADGNQATTSAKTALSWHRAGLDVIAVTRGRGSVYVTGAKTHTETEREKTDRENREHCKRISDELDDYTSGRVYRCPECGELVTMPDDVGDVYRCPNCANVDDVCEYEQQSLYDYFEDALDIEYVISSSREYSHGRVCVTWGGPSIWIDTDESAVCLYWWGDRAKYGLLSDTRDAIDDYLRELWEMG